MIALKKMAVFANRIGGVLCGVALVVSALAVPASAVLPPPPSPEIDPASLASAVALVVGGVLVLRGRIRR